MIVYPAIDLSLGKIVRLYKGDFNNKKIYDNKLITQIKSFEDNGAKWVHVVDLDGAFAGKNKNIISIKEILENSNCKIQLGGGIRTLKDIEKWLELGINRVIIGTAAIVDKNLVKEAIKLFPKTISVGLDLYENNVAINGWTKVIKEKKAEYYFKKFSDLGVESIIYTDINNDGVLKGPNFEMILEYKKMTQVPLVASGGISNIGDLKKLYSYNGYGVIVGKAIYENKVKLREIFDIK